MPINNLNNLPFEHSQSYYDGSKLCGIQPDDGDVHLDRKSEQKPETETES